MQPDAEMIQSSSPGGTISQEQTVTVTIEAIDMKVPSVGVKADNGHRMSFKVSNAKNLEGYKVGDTVENTYTQAISVAPAGSKPPNWGGA